MATLLEVDDGTVRRWMKRLGISRRAVSEALKVLWQDPKYREKTLKRMSETMWALWENPEFRERMSELHRHLWDDPEYREKCKNLKKLWQDPAYRREMSRKMSEAVAAANRRRWQNPDFREVVIPKLSAIAKLLWLDSNYLEAFYRGSTQKPSSFERFFAHLAEELAPGLFRYVGDYQFRVVLPGGKIKFPDFVVVPFEEHHIVVELYGNYWHQGEDPQELVDQYAQVGITCVVIWEDDLYADPTRELERVMRYVS